jgi:hypothetical protein
MHNQGASLEKIKKMKDNTLEHGWQKNWIISWFLLFNENKNREASEKLTVLACLYENPPEQK